MSDSRNSRFVEGLLLGGLVGAMAGLLLAPRTGEEARRDLGDKAQEAYSKIQQTMREGFDAIEIAIAQGKDAARETREEMFEVLEKVREPIEEEMSE